MAAKFEILSLYSEVRLYIKSRALFVGKNREEPQLLQFSARCRFLVSSTTRVLRQLPFGTFRESICILCVCTTTVHITTVFFESAFYYSYYFSKSTKVLFTTLVVLLLVQVC